MKFPTLAIVALGLGLALGTYLSPARTAVVPQDEHADTNAVVQSATPVVPQPVSELPRSEPPPVDTTDALQALRAAVAELGATEAAPMVARLSNAEAIGVLKGMPLTRASEILAAMPPERGSELSRLLLLAGAGT